MAVSELVLELALEVGFDLAGIAPLAPPPAARRFEAWLEAGRHADMAWLERNRERIVDPRRVLPEGRSLLVVGAGHPRPAVELPGGGRVARYAAGRDYHNVLGRRLRKLGRRLGREGLVRRWRSVVDAGPLLERSHGAEAGLGFESKAAHLLSADLGPWFFLGELLLDVELEPTPAPPAGSCGTCTACLDACPTDAIVAPGLVDARLCISYHTIENRGPSPPELRASFGEWVFGCDVCSEVCPWGRDAGDASERFGGTHAAVESGGLIEWLRAPAAGFAERFRGSAVQRARPEGLARNAAVALGNRPSEAGRAALLEALSEHSHPDVREAAAWALAHAHGADAGIREALERAAAREPDPTRRAALADSRERAGGG